MGGLPDRDVGVRGAYRKVGEPETLYGFEELEDLSSLPPYVLGDLDDCAEDGEARER